MTSLLLSVRHVLRCKVPAIKVNLRHASSLPYAIKPSQVEIGQRSLDSRSLELAIRHLHHDGLVVIEDVVPHEGIEKLNNKMVEDALTLQARGKDGPFNYNQGNLQQDAPPLKEHFSPSIFANPFATQVTSTMLGPRPKLTFCSGNSAMPPLPGASPQRQPVRSNADFAHPAHPFALVVNVPLVSMEPKNGSTEVWLGTYKFDISTQEGKHGERASGRIKEDLLEERRAICPPSQPLIPKGSVVIRDLRLWHAGMPNMSYKVCVMLAMIHFAPWYRNQMKLELSEKIKPLIGEAEGDLEIPVQWVSEEEAAYNYMHRPFGNAYDLDQAA